MPIILVQYMEVSARQFTVDAAATVGLAMNEDSTEYVQGGGTFTNGVNGHNIERAIRAMSDKYPHAKVVVRR